MHEIPFRATWRTTVKRRGFLMGPPVTERRPRGRRPKIPDLVRIRTQCWHWGVLSRGGFSDHDELLAMLEARTGERDEDAGGDVRRTWDRYRDGVAEPSEAKLAIGEAVACGSARLFACPAWNVLGSAPYAPGSLLPLLGAVEPSMLQSVLAGSHPQLAPGTLCDPSRVALSRAETFLAHLEMFAAAAILLDLHFCARAPENTDLDSLGLLRAARGSLGLAFSDRYTAAHYGLVCELLEKAFPFEAALDRIAKPDNRRPIDNFFTARSWHMTSAEISDWRRIFDINETLRTIPSR